MVVVVLELGGGYLGVELVQVVLGGQRARARAQEGRQRARLQRVQPRAAAHLVQH